jgi:hypothetical protein
MDLKWEQVKDDSAFKDDLEATFGKNILSALSQYVKHDGSNCASFVQVRIPK